MKSRISFFNKTIFLKNLTRFAPAWGLYTIGLLMALVILIDSGTKWYATNLADFVQIMAVFTPCYALLCAQLLLGDLYNSRMCNALHALPLRRETWFATHVLSGFAFHLIPTAAFFVPAALVAIFACYPGDWLTAALWLLGVNLQFMCFFGIAVLSAFCVGNRFAQAVVYGIVNFGSLIVGWLVNTIFVPMYYGIKIDTESFYWFSPMARMMSEDFFEHTRTYRYDQLDLGRILPGENFLYYFLAAAVGIGLIFLALHLYRRRRLECAGDFMAIPVLEPVFQVVYTVIVGAVFHFIADDMLGMESFLFLFLGLAVGWFTGRMLQERTTRVFRRKNLLHCGILMAVCALTLVIAARDPFGIESWIPDADEVESVTIADGHYNYHTCELTLEDPEHIQKIIQIHEDALAFYETYDTEYQFRIETAETTSEYTPEDWKVMDYDMAFTFTYHLKNGAERSRYYYIWMGGDTGAYLKILFSTPKAIFGYDADLSRFLAENASVVVRDSWEGLDTKVHSQADLTDLYRAILADCEANTMAQEWSFHNRDDSLYWLLFDSGLEVTVFSNAEHTIQWLRNYGFDVDDILEKRSGLPG